MEDVKVKDNSIQARFLRYHAKNPHVYDILVAMARKAKSAGKTKTSIMLLLQVARWEVMFQTESDDGFKISNNYAPRYARLIMEKEKDLEGFFDIKQLWTP